MFKFQRTLLYFVLQSYVPATLIVNLSWVSFWVDPRSIPARASLAITTVLTMITLMGTVNSQLPKVSNIKALDVYFGMCFFYVFGALIEFSAVCYLDKGRQKSQIRKKEAEKVAKEHQVVSFVNGLLSIFCMVSSFHFSQEAEQSRLKVLKEVDGMAMATHPNHDQMEHHGSNSVNNPSQPLLLHHSINNHHGPSGGLGLNNGTSFNSGSMPRRSLSAASRRDTLTARSREPSLDPKAAGAKLEMAGPSIFCSNFDVLRIDNYSRVIFPSTFLILNLLYWGAYTNIMSSVTEKTEE